MSKSTDPTRAFLETVREARIEHARALRRTEELASRAEKITTSFSAAPGNGLALGPPAVWSALCDARSKAEERERKWLRQELAVESFIDSLNGDLNRIVLRARYVDLLRWPEILDRLESLNIHYSDRQLYRLHGRALEEARRKWKELHREEITNDNINGQKQDRQALAERNDDVARAC